MSDFAETLVRSMRGDRDDDTPKLSRIGQVARLREFAAVYAAPNTFKVGDLVTPRDGGNLKGVGEPYLVVESLAEPVRSLEGNPASNGFGWNLNVRAACLFHGQMTCFWLEHHTLEPYAGDGSRPGDLDQP